jgi:hypothetical protein
VTLQDLGNIGELVGAVGVVVSLVYLAVQIRQNTKTVRATSVQELTEDINKGAAALIVPQNAELYVRGIRSYATLSPEEKMRFGQMINVLVDRTDTVLEFQRLGLIRESFVEARLEGLRVIFSNPGVREYWERSSHLFTREVRDWVEENTEVRRGDEADRPPLADVGRGSL